MTSLQNPLRNPLVGEQVYFPRRGKQLGLSAIAIGAGCVLWAGLAKQLALWMHAGIAPDAGAIRTALIASICVLAGLFIVIGVLRGRPRVTVNSEGIEVRYIWKTCWAAWSSLSSFGVTTMVVGRSKRQFHFATANIIGASTSPNLRGRSKLSLPNAFHVPAETIAANLNTLRAQLRGLPPASAPMLADDENRYGLAGFKAPWMTFGIIAVLVAAFVAERFLAFGGPGAAGHLNVPTLMAAGGLNRNLVVGGGEWYRLFTAPLLHASLPHLIGNCTALLMAGYQLERLVGRVWFLALFVIGGIGGSIASLLFDPATLTSVGASGAISGLFAAVFVSSFRLGAGTVARTRMQVRSLLVLFPSLLPLATTPTATVRVDYPAHIGGALTCTVVMLLVVMWWRDGARLPQFRRLAVGMALAGLALLVGSALAASTHFAKYKVLPALIPQAELPRKDDEAKQRAADLVARYPEDPRSHLFFGVNLFEAQDFAGAQRELKTGLTQTEEMPGTFAPSLMRELRGRLAMALLADGKYREAKEVAAALCRPAPGDAQAQRLDKLMQSGRLCD